MEILEYFIIPVRDSEVAQFMLLAMLLLILIDWLLGTIVALVSHNYSSEVARKGIAHKAGELCFVLLGIVIDACIGAGVDIGVNAPVLIGTCTYIIIMEIGSILETIGEMNPELADSPVFELLHTMQKHRTSEETTEAK